MTDRVAKAKRLVVKIGSALLVESESGEIRQDWLDGLAADIALCRTRGQDVLIVSSGSIALGRRQLGLLEDRRLRLEESQAAAAAGQIRLAHAYQQILARHDISVAQILLTLDDTEDRRRHLNARSTLNQLLQLDVVPVINENDTVATNEIRFGDNDRLAARVAAMTSADCLVLLSDIDGLYDADPRQNSDAAHIPDVDEITPEIEAMAGAAPVGYSSGGMVTKLDAAKIAMGGGCDMVITDGKPDRPLTALSKGARATWFNAKSSPLTARKRWIAGAVNPVGEIIVDDGAVKALAAGKSLLPAGITEITGEFARGDAVRVLDGAGREIGRGLTAYSAHDAARIKGHKSSEIEAILGYRGRDELIHRDNLVLNEQTSKA
ncbi:MAG TPA: glutamate 5-kinase [Rhodospirillaceae bacterium]|nr:glutamate 5-kinase [Rhodospirillaceae bacterium]HAT35781.1 glutamate 5-kinase [Rhodospirillaceae bacterium]